MDNWELFTKTQVGVVLREFFVKLNREISDSIKNNGRSAVLLLNTRKGYWIYKIFEKYENGHIDQIEVMSDRYVKKVLTFKRLQKKIVYLIDDTLTRGYSLFQTYELLAEYINVEDICPVVFALREDVDLIERKKYASGREKMFWESLKYYVRMSSKDLGAFCIEETKLIHTEGIPFVVDLPYLKDKEKIGKKLTFTVELNNEQFQSLTKPDEKWEFHKVNYKYHKGIARTNDFFDGFIFQMKENKLLKITKEFVHDFIVEGTCKQDENGKIQVVFIPFAILKSQELSFQDKLWSILFPEKTQVIKKQTNNLYIKLYRENVYVLSMMIAHEFMKFFAKRTGKELVYDYDILCDHFTSKFIREMKVLEKEMDKIENLIPNRLKQIEGETNNVSIMVERKVDVEKRTYMEQEGSVVFYEELDWRKNRIENSQTKHTLFSDINAMIPFEEMEDIFDRTFRYHTLEDKRYSLTKEIIQSLNLSICGNKLEVFKEKGIIGRGFRYGENSDLLLPFFDGYFYWAILLMVIKYDYDFVARIYEKFIRNLRQNYEKWGFISTPIEKRNFERNQKYYEKQIIEKNDLFNKYFFIEPYIRGMIDYKEKFYMSEIEKIVEQYKG